jgi:hypothetical protein
MLNVPTVMPISRARTILPHGAGVLQVRLRCVLLFIPKEKRGEGSFAVFSLARCDACSRQPFESHTGNCIMPTSWIGLLHDGRAALVTESGHVTHE